MHARIAQPSARRLARALALSLSLGLGACDPFEDVKKADTIEAFEGWLAENPDPSSQTRLALQRLDELYLERARTQRDVAAFDKWLARFPKDTDAAKVAEEREAMLFAIAEEAGTEAGWKAFLDAAPQANVKRKAAAAEGAAAAQYAGKLAISPVEIKPVNLARDPAGEMNGTGFFAEVTNQGDQTLAVLWFNLLLLDGEGKVAQRADAPVAATADRGRIRKELLAPLKPGETRTFYWGTDQLPAGFAQQARLVPSRLVAAP
jgi:hypothetical protein